MASYKVHQVRQVRPVQTQRVMIVLLCLFLSLPISELGRVPDQLSTALPTMNKSVGIAADEFVQKVEECFKGSGLLSGCSALGKAWQQLNWDAGEELEELSGGDGLVEIKGGKAAAMVNPIQPSLEMNLSDGMSAKELLLLVFPKSRSCSVNKLALNHRRFSNNGNFQNHFHYRAIPWQRKVWMTTGMKSEGSGGRGRPRRRRQAEEPPIPTVTIEEHVSERLGRERVVKFAVVAGLMIWFIIFS